MSARVETGTFVGRRRAAAIVASCLLGSLAIGASAQVAFPTKPVRIIVAYPPGGANDALARSVGQRLSEMWKQPVVVENRAGASGMIGMEYVARSPADGHTLILGSLTQAILPALHPKMSFDPVNDFAPVAIVGIAPFIMVVHPSVPANSMTELIALAKASPGKLSYGTAGSGTGPHLALEFLKRMAGVDIVHVPYKGSGPAMADLVGGQLQVTMDVPPSALPQIQAGRVRAIAVSGTRRIPDLPNLPTIAESGVPGFDVTSWWGVLAPASTPRDIVQRLNADINQALDAPEVRQRFARLGMEVTQQSSDQFNAVIQKDAARYAKLIKDANIKAD